MPADQQPSALLEIGRIDRNRCRREFERRFSAERMAADYVELYRRLVAGETEERPLDERPEA